MSFIENVLVSRRHPTFEALNFIKEAGSAHLRAVIFWVPTNRPAVTLSKAQTSWVVYQTSRLILLDKSILSFIFSILARRRKHLPLLCQPSQGLWERAHSSARLLLWDKCSWRTSNPQEGSAGEKECHKFGAFRVFRAGKCLIQI